MDHPIRCDSCSREVDDFERSEVDGGLVYYCHLCGHEGVVPSEDGEEDEDG